MKTTHALALIAPLLLLALGCETEPKSLDSAPPQHTTNSAHDATEPDARIMLDGTFDDWAQPNTARADERFLYLTFAPSAGQPQAIQAAPYTTRIRIDADANPRTGAPIAYPATSEAIAAQPQGVDLLIELSPKNKQGDLSGGCRVTGYDPTGEGEAIGHAAVGFACLPTYASPRYEARVDRLAPGARLLQSQGPIEIVIDQLNPNGSTRWSTRMVAQLPKAAPEAPAKTAAFPARPDNAVRVMSANVLYSSPLKKPEPFARVFHAIDPDVVLYQEWFRTPAENVKAWLETHAGDNWTLHMPDERAGVAIATRRPVLATYDSVLPPSGEGRPARAAAALIDTGDGQLLAISVHLKCCGGAGSGEDITRTEQAASLNAFVRQVHAKHPAAQVIIGGDFNLVGSRTPLDTLARGLSANGGDLTPALSPVLGDNSAVTWVDDRSSFSPGRLDWMLYDDSTSDVINAFMLDTRALGPQALQAAGLKAQDSASSDHLPTIIDLAKAR